MTQKTQIIKLSDSHYVVVDENLNILHEEIDGVALSQWITIGGKQEGDSKHAGGFPVEISDDGTIIKGGPKGLHGKKVSDVKTYFDAKAGKMTDEVKKMYKSKEKSKEGVDKTTGGDKIPLSPNKTLQKGKDMTTATATSTEQKDTEVAQDQIKGKYEALPYRIKAQADHSMGQAGLTTDDLLPGDGKTVEVMLKIRKNAAQTSSGNTAAQIAKLDDLLADLGVEKPAEESTSGTQHATYTRLRSGEWGAKVPISTVEGQDVLVKKKNGVIKREKVKKILYRGTFFHLVVLG